MPRGGVRPGAGRKSYGHEINRINDLARCWDIVMQFLNSDAPLEKKAELASRFALKTMPDKVINKGDMEINIKINKTDLEERMKCFVVQENNLLQTSN